MVAGAHRNAICIEECPDVVRVDLVDHEGKNGSFVRRRTNDSETINRGELCSRIFEQRILMGKCTRPV